MTRRSTTLYSIGIDGGGTRTRAVLVDGAGNVRGSGFAGPSNPHSAGPTAAGRAVLLAAKRALTAARASRREVALVALGAAGLADLASRRSMHDALSREFAAAKIHVTTDAELALAASGERADCGPKVAVIAGTGSIALGCDKKGTRVRAGGYGYRIGDEGSGAWIGREALARAQRAIDGRAAKTALVDALCETLRCRREDLRLAAHRAAESASSLAALVPIVALAADDGDVASAALLRLAGTQLAELAACVDARVRRSSSRKAAVICCYGGVFEHLPRVERAFRAELRRRIGASPTSRRVQPELAAIELAQATLGDSEGTR